jgi:integrase
MAYRWAVRHRLIGSSPVEGVRKPVRASRGTKAVITEAEHRKLLAVADGMFGDYLTLLWHTGARPGEVAGLTAEQVKASTDGIIPLVNHKLAHKGKARFLILSGEAWAVAKRRAEAVGSGLLFVGRLGPLTPKAVCSKMDRLCEKAGIRRLMAYGYRHTFATDALVRGLPDATVAALLGHGSTAMLHRHYSHLTAQAQAMREALVRVRG